MPGGFLWSRPACNQSVTEGPWGSAVNWVKAQRDISANMTQYRVNARNCEAKRLHTSPTSRVNSRMSVSPDSVCPKRAVGPASKARRPVPAHAGVWWPYYGKLVDTHLFFRTKESNDHTTRTCQLHSCARHGRGPARKFRTSGRPDGHGGHCPGPVGRFPQAQPGPPRMGGPRPVRAVQRPCFDAAVFASVPDGLPAWPG